MNESLLDRINQLSSSLNHSRLQALTSYKELGHANKGIRRLAYKAASLKSQLSQAKLDIEKLERANAEKLERLQLANLALGYHEDSNTDFAAEISRLRDEGRGHFHTVTALHNKLKDLSAAKPDPVADCNQRLAEDLLIEKAKAKMTKKFETDLKEGDEGHEAPTPA